jgi:hypothetical protein
MTPRCPRLASRFVAPVNFFIWAALTSVSNNIRIGRFECGIARNLRKPNAWRSPMLVPCQRGEAFADEDLHSSC